MRAQVAVRERHVSVRAVARTSLARELRKGFRSSSKPHHKAPGIRQQDVLNLAQVFTMAELGPVITPKQQKRHSIKYGSLPDLLPGVLWCVLGHLQILVPQLQHEVR